MEDEHNKKRVMIPISSDGSGLLKAGDDIPKLDADAPQVSSAHVITMQSMASYIRALSSDSRDGNKYKINDSHETFSIRNSDGSPSALVTPNDGVFAASEELARLGVLTTLFDQETISNIRNASIDTKSLLRNIMSNGRARLDKTSQDPINISTGRAEISDNSNAPEIQKKISNVLLKNRFNPTPGKSAYIRQGTAASELDNRTLGRFQTNLGGYDNRPTTDADAVTYEKMKKVGLALMLRATGEFIGKESDPTGLDVGIASLIPGSAQLTGARVIDRRSMWASDLSVDQGRPADFDKKSMLDSDITLDDGQSSFGNLNTFLEPFDGFLPLGMVALGAALVVALKLLSEVIEAAAMVLNPPGLSNSMVPRPEGAILFPGKSNYKEIDSGIGAVTNFFGFYQTKHDFGSAFDRGVDIFFQFDGTSFLRIAKTPGYYVVFVREIIRSGAQLVRTIGEAFSSGNPVSAIQGLLGIVDLIRASKIVAYVNMVSVLGDNILTLEDQGYLYPDSIGVAAEPGELPNFGKISKIDNLVLNPVTRISKNRETNDALSLAWKTSATPSMYLLPNTVLNASDYMPAESSLSLNSMTDVPSELRDKQRTARIDEETARKIENELDSEYVPFYFQDLRTNEFVSFHAFLTAITDNFNVSYNSEKFHGRVEPVRTYSDTERSIGLTFNVVSTSQSDFDVMWWKINKLITLLYPQWSQGRKVNLQNEQKMFIQPFSQIPMASPVIRLRLGDVIKSNYSKFALGRLFGLGSSDFGIDGKVTDPNRIESIVAFNKKFAERRKNILTKPVTSTDTQKYGYRIDTTAYLQPTNELAYAGTTIQTVGRPIKSVSSPVKVKIKDIKIVTLASKRSEPVYSIELDASVVPEGFFAGTYVVHFDQLTPDDESIKNDVTTLDGLDEANLSDADITPITDFFSNKNNVIVRSFESVAGRGLAGVITSMNFDWKTPTWDTTTIGRRAPQWCQITIAFSPIHDIAPGIDYEGFNRAPIYNVGNIVNSVGGDSLSDSTNKDIKSRYDKESLNFKKPKGG